MAGIKAADLQYILNTITFSEYQKAYGLDNTFLSRIRFGAGPGRIQIPFHYGGNATAGSFGESDDISAAGKQSRRTVELPYKRVYVTTGVDGLQEAIAKAGGVQKIDDLVTTELLDSIEDLFDQINTQLLGDGTGNASKDIDGVQYHIDDSNTWAGLSRATYTWLQSHVDDNAGVNRSLSEALMRGVHNTMVDTRKSNYSAIWTSSEMVDAYENLLGTRQRRADIRVGDLALEVPTFKSKPFVPIPGYSANRMDFVRESDFSVVYLPHEAMDSIGRTVRGMFKVEPVAQVTDDSAFNVIAYLQLVCKNPWKQGSLQDVQ